MQPPMSTATPAAHLPAAVIRTAGGMDHLEARIQPPAARAAAAGARYATRARAWLRQQRYEGPPEVTGGTRGRRCRLSPSVRSPSRRERASAAGQQQQSCVRSAAVPVEIESLRAEVAAAGQR